MIKDKSKLQQFDILLFKPKTNGDIIGNTICFFENGGKYCHAAMYDKLGYLWESHINSGCVRREMNNDELELIDVGRLNIVLNLFDKEKLEGWMNETTGSKYDPLAFPGTFLRSTVAPIFGWRHYSKTRPILDGKGYYCSEWISCGFNHIKLPLRPDLNCHSVTPSDLANSKKLTLIDI